MRGLVLVLFTITAAVAAGPTSTTTKPNGVVGARKLATVHDCATVVAFSGTGARSVDAKHPLAFHNEALDKGVGWSKDSGEFTCHCPGLYQFSFAGSTKLSLKKQTSGSETWTSVVSTGDQGGANTVLLDMEVGDKVAVWLQGSSQLPKDEDDAPTSSFSGYRIAKK